VSTSFAAWLEISRDKARTRQNIFALRPTTIRRNGARFQFAFLKMGLTFWKGPEWGKIAEAMRCELQQRTSKASLTLQPKLLVMAAYLFTPKWNPVWS
jgi:hypothetical protein